MQQYTWQHHAQKLLRMKTRDVVGNTYIPIRKPIHFNFWLHRLILRTCVYTIFNAQKSEILKIM